MICRSFFLVSLHAGVWFFSLRPPGLPNTPVLSPALLPTDNYLTLTHVDRYSDRFFSFFAHFSEQIRDQKGSEFFILSFRTGPFHRGVGVPAQLRSLFSPLGSDSWFDFLPFLLTTITSDPFSLFSSFFFFLSFMPDSLRLIFFPSPLQCSVLPRNPFEKQLHLHLPILSPVKMDPLFSQYGPKHFRFVDSSRSFCVFHLPGLSLRDLSPVQFPIFVFVAPPPPSTERLFLPPLLFGVPFLEVPPF